MAAKSRTKKQGHDRGDGVERPAKRSRLEPELEGPSVGTGSESGDHSNLETQQDSVSQSEVAEAMLDSEDDGEEYAEPPKASDLYLDTVSHRLTALVDMVLQHPTDQQSKARL